VEEVMLDTFFNIDQFYIAAIALQEGTQLI
jgi:hypothetical protein